MPTVRVELTEEDQKTVAILFDAAIKAMGLPAAIQAVMLLQKMERAKSDEATAS